MNYKKFALAAAVAGMLVSCGKTTPPAAPDWSAAQKAFIAEMFYNVDLPYFFSSEFGNLDIDANPTYKAILVDGDKELTSSESIKAAADFLAELGFEDSYAGIRGNPKYPYATEWTYPMEKRLVVEELGARYVLVSLSGQAPEATSLAAEGDEQGSGKYFHCEVFDPYDYTWTDSAASDYISYAFGGVDERGYYYNDETIESELVDFLYPATFPQSGAYVPYIAAAQEEVQKKGYLTFGMMDVAEEDLALYIEDLKDANWQVFPYEPEEVEEGYLPKLYKFVSPSEYFEMDVYAKDGDVMLQIELLPEYSEVVGKVANAVEGVIKYDFSYSEEYGSYAYYGDVSYFEYGPTEEEAAALKTAEEAKAAYDALVELEGASVVDAWVAQTNYYGEGVLDIDNHMILVGADYDYTDLIIFQYDFYFYWNIIVADWPEYPEFLTSAFAEAAGANNIHQFYEMKDGSLTFAKEGGTAEQAAAAFAALKALEGASVLSEYSEVTNIGRLQFGDLMVMVEYVVQQEETRYTAEEAAKYNEYYGLEEGDEGYVHEGDIKDEAIFGYMVSITEIPEVEDFLKVIAPAVPGFSAFDFVYDEDYAEYQVYAPAESAEIGETIWNNLLALSSEEVEVNVLVEYAYAEGEGVGRVQVGEKQVSVYVFTYSGVLYYQVSVGELPVFPGVVNAAAEVLELSSVYQFQYYPSYEEYIYFPSAVPEDFGAEAEACFNKLAAIEGAVVETPFSFTPAETEGGYPTIEGNIVVGDYHIYLDLASGGQNFCVCIGSYYAEPAEHPYTLAISTALGAEEDVFSWSTSKGTFSCFAEEFGPDEMSAEAAEGFFAEVSEIILGVDAFEGETFVPTQIKAIPQVDSYWGDEWTDYEISYESENYIITIYIDNYYVSWGIGYPADVTITIQPK